MTLDLATDIMIALSVIGVLSFSGAYFLKSDWRSTAPGRDLLCFIAALTLLGLTWVVELIFGRYHYGHDVLRFIVYSSIALASWRMFFTLRKMQKESKRIQIDPL